jgi:putative zinc finger protein
MTSQHPGDRALDRLLLGAASAEEANRLRAHLDGCGECRAEWQARQDARAQFEGHVLPRTLGAVRRRLADEAPPERRRWWLWALAPALTLCGVLLIFAAPWLRRAAGSGDDLGIKGGPALEVVARRGDRVFHVDDGAALAAGDQIRFVVVPAGHEYLVIGSIDGSGKATLYHPYGGAESAHVGSVERLEVPGTIALDASPGPERLFAVFSDRPIPASAVENALRELGRGGADAIRKVRQLPIPNTAQISLRLEKQP